MHCTGALLKAASAASCMSLSPCAAPLCATHNMLIELLLNSQASNKKDILRAARIPGHEEI